MSDLLWGNLIHLSFNMWEDRDEPSLRWRCQRDYLPWDEPLWDDLLDQMVAAGINLVVLDLGDGVHWESHPEIAVGDAWTCDRLGEELARMRELGIEPIPKLNFATTHDAWLKEYGRMVSTPAWYQVASDLIAEAIALFDTPRFFHLGMDEETYGHQRYYEYVVVRQFDLYYHDCDFLLEQVSGRGVRPWIWSDRIWHDPVGFCARTPRSVLQSNWYYQAEFPDDPPAEPDAEGHLDRLGSYLKLDREGYDQIPTASNHSHATNFAGTVEFCRRKLDPSRLLGFLQTPWRPTIEEFRDRHVAAIEQVAAARRDWLAG